MEQHDPIIEMARRWVIRQASGEMGPADHQQLAAWLNEDQRHRSAFEAENQLWALSGRLAPGLLGHRTAISASGEIGGSRPVSHRARPHGIRPSPFAGAAIAALVLVACAAALFLSDLLVMIEADVRTAAGQQRRIELPDGSVAYLNTASALALVYSGSERQVRLLRGEAFFEVRPRANLPFRVETDQGTAEAVGTAFGVSSLNGTMTVTISEGKVAVHVAGPVAQARDAPPVLKANQSFAFSPAAKSASLRTVDADKSLAWRGGKIAFERTPFAEAIAELDRYFPGRIVTVAHTAALSPVTGVVNVNDVVAGIRAIAAVEGLTVTAVPGSFVLILH